MGNIRLIQTAGLGDVFYIQKMCTVLSKENTVYLPVENTTWDRGANRLITDAVISPLRDLKIDTKNLREIDLSYQPKPNGYIDTMTSKYDGVNIDWRDWKNYFKYTRDHEAEERVASHYGVEPGDRFVVRNDYYSSQIMVNGGVEKTLPRGYTGNVVNIDPNLPNTTVFDYCWLFENAEEIHTTDTCFLYIIDTLDLLRADRLVVHCRKGETTKQTISQLFGKTWEWY